MTEATFFSNNMGEGYISDDPIEMEQLLDKKNIFVANENIEPGQETTINGFYTKAIKYVGVLKTNHQAIIFYIGQRVDLFSTTHYYQLLYLIDNDRLFEMFTEKSGRDFNFINGKWK